MNIEWTSEKNEILINPRFPKEEQQRLMQLFSFAPHLKGHIWVATSGTSGQVKWVALSKQAVLSSANAVNQHLLSDHNDCWLNALPEFHVGGLGIIARSYLSRSKMIIFNEKWHPCHFCESLNKSFATLTSLVPTQIYDIVMQKLTPPHTLRAVIIGGGKLSDNLFSQALQLGWPLLPSYGLTECSSQVATGSWGGSELKLLNHIQCRIESDQRIALKSDSLLTLYGFWEKEKPHFVDPKKNGWFLTEDRGELNHRMLKVFGRESQFVKIGGESVDLNRLEQILETIKMEKQLPADMAIIALPDVRLGHTIHLCTTVPHAEEVLEEFQKRVLPFERIKRVHQVPCIPRTPLLKIVKSELLKLLELQ